MFSTNRSSGAPVADSASTGFADPETGNRTLESKFSWLKLMQSIKNVINWNTTSRSGVRFGSALISPLTDALTANSPWIPLQPLHAERRIVDARRPNSRIND
jgi:hypothetical protein